MTVAFRFETATSIAAVSGQKWSLAPFLRLIAGSFGAPSSAVLQIIENNGAGAFLVTNAGAVSLPTAGALTTQRPSYTATLINAATAFVQPGLAMNYASGAVIDWTLRIGLPQAERGACISSPILPAVGVPGASTPAVDQTRITGLTISAATLLVQ